MKGCRFLRLFLALWLGGALFIGSTEVSGLEKVRDYPELVSFIKDLGGNFRSEILGTVEYGSYAYPIYRISYNPDSTGSSRYLVLCGVHGNEAAPVFAIKEFLQSLDRKAIRRPELRIDFVFIVNPRGFERNDRYSGVGAEINRDMRKQSTPEARILAEHCKPGDYDRVFDFHEASSRGFFLYCYGRKNLAYARGILDCLGEAGVNLETGYKDIILKARKGMLYVPWFGSLFMSVRNRITVGQYFMSCKNSFTLETPKSAPLAERKRTVTILLEYLAGH